jgi:hypothetical protein
MKLPEVEYEAPTTVAEAIDLLAEHGDEASVLAGGQSLIPLLALRLARPEVLIDINRIDELSGVSAADGQVAIGAMTREYVAEESGTVADTLPLLAAALPLIGHEAIRSRGTIGGSLAHADPAAELPAVARALDAEFVVRGPSGERVIPAAQWFEGYLTTSRRPDELLAEVRFPAAGPGTGLAFRRSPGATVISPSSAWRRHWSCPAGSSATPGWRSPAYLTCRSGPPPRRICWPGRGRRRSCSMRRPAVRPRISTRRPTFTGRRTTGRRSRPLWCAAACEQQRTTPARGSN